ncbi:MAG TPA: Calx-beta domain-containing protein [Pyrinomonadaceae bacterium]
MRHPWKLPLAVVCLLALASLPLLPARRGAAQSAAYTAVEVPTLGGDSAGLALDECGRVAGESVPAGGSATHPFFWDGAAATDIGTFDDANTTRKGVAHGLNSAGAAAGTAESGGGEQRPFVWTQAAGKSDFGPPGATLPYDINETNTVVGQWEVSQLQDRAFVWTQAAGMQTITADWGTPIAAYGVNNAGHVVGSAQIPSGPLHGFFKNGATVVEIGTLGGRHSHAYDVSDAGVVVGQASASSNAATDIWHAFRWKDDDADNVADASEIQDLGTLGGLRSTAYGVNSSGQIVGYSDVSGGGRRAFLWTPGGPMQDLNALAPTAGWTFLEARGVNDRGQIVVTAVNGSEQRRAFLLTPAGAGPSPCAAATPTPTPTPAPTPTPTPGSLAFNSPVYAVAENAGQATITVIRTGGKDGAVTVNYATSNGTAAAGGEYTAASGSLNWADGDADPKSFNIPVADDALDEENKTVNLSLSAPGGGAALGAQTTAVLTINDNEAEPTMKVFGPPAVVEGNAGATDAEFVVRLSAASAKTVTVNYGTVDLSAEEPDDYQSASGTLTFSPGETARTVKVAVKGDTVDEPDEGFVFTLNSPTNATFQTVPNDTFAYGVITDDDGAPSLSVGDATVTEGHTGTTAATFTVRLLPASGQTVTVNYATANDTATAGADYAAASGKLTFDPGQTTRTVTVNVNGDTTPEQHEAFFLNLSGATNAGVTNAGGRGTINNDDTSLKFGAGPNANSDGDVETSEGNSGPKAFTFTVSLSHATVTPVSVNYSTANGTATAGSDYTAISNATLNIPANATTGQFNVQVTGDNIFEENETFFVNLSGASAGATITDAQAKGTILNDEATSNFSMGGPNLFAEENAGSFKVTVTRTGSLAGGVSVNYSTSNGTATAGSDYTAASGTLTFGEGETVKEFSIAITNDTLDEPEETISLNLSGGFGGLPGSSTFATLHVGDNDDPPTFQLNQAAYTVVEGNVNVNVTITRTGGTNGGALVVYSATAGTSFLSGTATPGEDYTAIDAATFTFAEGEMSKTFSVAIRDDALDEPDETVILSVGGGSGTALGSPTTAVLTITDNDATPSLSVDDAVGATAANEFDSSATVTLKLSAASGQPVTVKFTTANGTATAGSDYSATSATVTFAPGETIKWWGVPLINDTIDEADETFFVNLSDASGAGVADAQGVITIKDDEGEPLLSVDDVFDFQLKEGDAGMTNAAFKVTLSPASAQPVTVNYATVDGPGLFPHDPVVAVAGADYIAASGTLTFEPGQTVKTINVAVKGDTLDEFNEKFSLNLSGAAGALVTRAQGTGTIGDDDAEPAFSVSDASVTEGHSGVTLATFTITLSAPSGRATSAYYSTANGTASMEDDYTYTFGEPVFEPGETSKTFSVPVHGDNTDEPDETFFVNLATSSYATVADAQGVGTILNDDATRLQFSQATYTAGEGSHFVTVTVERAGRTDIPVTVDFATGGGTASERRDYTAASGTLRFAAAEMSRTFDVLLTDDAYAEPDETINLKLSNAAGGASLGARATAAVVIAGDIASDGAQANPIDDSAEFVRQHYHDFLNREPDADGLRFWVDNIEECGADAACREVKRVNVSAAFFLSIEFQETGYLVYRVFKSAYGDATSPNVGGTVPVVRLQEFLPDTRRIGEGVVVGPGPWRQQLEANKSAYALEFVRRARFLARYPHASAPAQFVDALYANAGVAPSAAERQAAVDEFGAAATTADEAARARVLRRVAEHPALAQAEFNRAFVLMQFYGYLRRNPDDPQDTDFRGWRFWLDKLNQFGGNFSDAEMVKAFLSSDEYRNRFGQ